MFWWIVGLLVCLAMVFIRKNTGEDKLRINSEPGKIILVNGENGHGKTAWVVQQILLGHLGPLVYTNIQPNEETIRQKFPNAPTWIYCEDPFDRKEGPLALISSIDPETGVEVKVTRVREGVVVVDEASQWWPGSTVSEDMAYILDQKRKLGITLVLICPFEDRIPKRIRQAVSHQYLVRYFGQKRLRFMLWSVYFPPVRKIFVYDGIHPGDADAVGPWAVNRDSLNCYNTLQSTRGDVSTENVREFEKNHNELRRARLQTFRTILLLSSIIIFASRMAFNLFVKSFHRSKESAQTSAQVDLPLPVDLKPSDGLVDLPEGSECFGDVWRTPEGLYWRSGRLYKTLVAASVPEIKRDAFGQPVRD